MDSAAIPGLQVYSAVMASGHLRALQPPVLDEAPLSGRDGGRDGERVSEPPGSGPVSGVVDRRLFDGDAGPGYILTEDGSNEAVSLVFDGIDAGACKVVRMSPEALWFSAGAPRNLRFGVPVSLRVQWSGGTIGPLTGEVVQLNRNSRAYIGLRLLRVSDDSGRRILGMLNELARTGAAQAPTRDPAVHEDVTEAERLQTIVRALASVGNRGALRRPSGKPVRLTLERIEQASGALVWSSALPAAEWGPGPYSVDIIGYNSVYRLALAGASDVDGHVVTPMPTSARRVRHRWFRRGQAQSGLQVKFTHPLWPDIARTREVRDISFGGLCFTGDLDHDLMFPGLTLPAIEVRRGSGAPIYLRGEVRSIFPARGEESGACGLQLTPCSEEDERRWMQLVCEMLHPTTVLSTDALEPLWGLFAESGYFNLAGKSQSYFEDLRRGFVGLGQRSASVPHLICQAVWPSTRGIEATLSFLKAYKHTWMVHQLAKRPGAPPAEVREPGQILRDVYLRLFEHPQSDPDLKWLMCYLEPHVPWVRRAHVEFAERYVGDGLAYNRPLSMFEVFTTDAGAATRERWEIDAAAPKERDLLVNVLRATESHNFLESLDLVRGQFDMAKVSGQWQGAGLERERSVLVARKAGRPVCAAILETGQSGSNLFRLLDSVRLMPIERAGVAARPALMDAAKQWFAARGKETFLYLTEDEAGGRAVGVPEGRTPLPANHWCISATLLPEFLEHICEITSRRR